MNNGSAFSHGAGFSPIPGMNCITFSTPPPRQPYCITNFSNSRNPSFQPLAFPPPSYSSSPYHTVYSPQQRNGFSSPNAQQRDVNVDGLINSSGNWITPEKSFHGSFYSPYSLNSNSFRSEMSPHFSYATPPGYNSNYFHSPVDVSPATPSHLDSKKTQVNNLREVRKCNTNSGSVRHTSCNSAKSVSVDFPSPNLPQRVQYKATSTNPFRGKKRSRDETSNDRWEKSTNFRSNTKTWYKSRGSDQDKGRRHFRSPLSDESNPGHSSNIDDYVDPSMLEDPWKELMEKLEEKQRLEDQRVCSEQE